MKRGRIIQNGDPDEPCYSTGNDFIIKRNILTSGACTLSLAVSIIRTSNITSIIGRKRNIITSRITSRSSEYLIDISPSTNATNHYML